METIHLCASFFSILKIMAAPYEKELATTFSFSHSNAILRGGLFFQFIWRPWAQRVRKNSFSALIYSNLI